MNNETRRLIQYIVNNDIRGAKQFCEHIVKNDKTKTNELFCKSMINKLNTNIVELPFNLKHLLNVEDVENTFNEKRYYLSLREEEMFKEVKKMSNVSKKLNELRIDYLNSILLYGDSGTGKTTFGKYIAYKLGLPFYYMDFSNIIDSYLGKTNKNLKDIFTFIKQQKCVFMIDEIDAIGTKRGMANESGEMNRVVIGLLQEIDTLGCDTLLVAASNREDILDDALKRRFAIKHEIKKFNSSEIKCMINLLLMDIEMRALNIEVENYIEKHKNEPQAVIMNDVIRRIADTVENDSDIVKFD